jgi:hypothetical protein
VEKRNQVEDKQQKVDQDDGSRAAEQQETAPEGSPSRRPDSESPAPSREDSNRSPGTACLITSSRISALVASSRLLAVRPASPECVALVVLEVPPCHRSGLQPISGQWYTSAPRISTEQTQDASSVQRHAAQHPRRRISQFPCRPRMSAPGAEGQNKRHIERIRTMSWFIHSLSKCSEPTSMPGSTGSF